jgi:DNA topoisomerase VI subunit B
MKMPPKSSPGGDNPHNAERRCVVSGTSIGSSRLQRETFRTSRLLDFASPKELIAQTGHQPAQWPLVVIKEAIDNEIDACEERGIAPEITVVANAIGITVIGNGPGIPSETVKRVLDFTVRVSSREAYVSPTRGAQGNALKTIIAMPFVLDGQKGKSRSRHAASVTRSSSRWTTFAKHR